MRYVPVMPRSSASTLTPSEARRVAVLASVDPRTIATYLTGARATLPVTAKAIAMALRKIGRADLVKDPNASAAA